MSEYLFSTKGLDSLAQLCRKPFLMAFDFDGTLAPFVDDPTKARVSQSLRDCLKSMVVHTPIAVISGRCVFDLNARLEIPGCLLVGNHGAQSYPHIQNKATSDWVETLAPIREQINFHRGTWDKLQVTVEDKAISIALHYREAIDRVKTRTLLHSFVEHCLQSHRSLGLPELRIWDGNNVINIVSAVAPDKGDALLKLQKELQLSQALYVGDDSNDEPAFEKALPGSVTVKVCQPDSKTSAQFFLPEQSDVGKLLIYLNRSPLASTAHHQKIDSFAASVGPADHISSCRSGSSTRH